MHFETKLAQNNRYRVHAPTGLHELLAECRCLKNISVDADESWWPAEWAKDIGSRGSARAMTDSPLPAGSSSNGQFAFLHCRLPQHGAYLVARVLVATHAAYAIHLSGGGGVSLR